MKIKENWEIDQPFQVFALNNNFIIKFFFQHGTDMLPNFWPKGTCSHFHWITCQLKKSSQVLHYFISIHHLFLKFSTAFWHIILFILVIVITFYWFYKQPYSYIFSRNSITFQKVSVILNFLFCFLEPFFAPFKFFSFWFGVQIFEKIISLV